MEKNRMQYLQRCIRWCSKTAKIKRYKL